MAGIHKSFGNYFKNVAKSTAYLTRDIVDAEIPEVAIAADIGVKAASSIIDSVKNFDKMTERLTTSIKHSKVGRDVTDIIKNTAKDLKSGNFYKRDGMDSGDPFGSNNDYQYNMLQKSSQVSMSLTRAQMINDDKNNNINRVMWSRQHSENMSMNMTINNNIANLIDTMNEKIIPFLEDATNFMSDSISLQGEIQGILQEMNENFALMVNGPQTNVEVATKNGLEDIFNSDGSLRYENVAGMLKENVKKNYIDPIIDSFTDFEGNSILTEIAKNPIGFLLQNSIQNAIPYELRSSLYNFRQTLGGASAGLFERLQNQGFDNKFSALFNTLFDGMGKVKDKIEINKYEKGPIPFDGIVKKAVTHVIPTLLAKIYSAIIGEKDELIYSYDRGAFAWGKDLQAAHERALNDASESVFTDMKEKLNEALDTIANNNPGAMGKEQQGYLKAEFSNIIDYLKDQKGNFNPNDIRQQMDLEKEFGTAIFPFLKMYQMVFSQSERIQFNSLKMNAKMAKDRYMHSAQNDSQESGMGQLLGSRMADKIDSGIEYEPSEDVKWSRITTKLRKLGDIRSQLKNKAENNVISEIDSVIRQLENGKDVKIDDYYFTKPDYIKAVKNDSMLRQNASSTREQKLESKRKIDNLANYYRDEQNKNKDKAENTLVKRDNMFLTSINNIYEKLKSGIIVFPSADVSAVTSRTEISNKEKNEQRITERAVNNITDAYKNDQQVSPSDVKKIEKDSREPITFSRLNFKNNDKISSREAINLLYKNGMAPFNPEGDRTIDLLRKSLPNSGVVSLLDLIYSKDKKDTGNIDLSHLKTDPILTTAAQLLPFGQEGLNDAVDFINSNINTLTSWTNATDLYGQFIRKLSGITDGMDKNSNEYKEANQKKEVIDQTLKSLITGFGPLISDIQEDFGDNHPLSAGLRLFTNIFDAETMTDEEINKKLNSYVVEPPRKRMARDTITKEEAENYLNMINMFAGAFGMEIPDNLLEEDKAKDILELVNMALSNEQHDRLVKFLKRKKLDEKIVDSDWLNLIKGNSGLIDFLGGRQLLDVITEYEEDLADDGFEYNTLIKHFLGEKVNKNILKDLTNSLGKTVKDLRDEDKLPVFFDNDLADDKVLDEKFIIEQYLSKNEENFDSAYFDARFKYVKQFVKEKKKPYVDPVLDVVLGDKVQDRKVLYMMTAMLGKTKQEARRLGLSTDFLKDVPQNKQITVPDIVKAFADEYAENFNIDEFTEKYNAYLKQELEKKLSYGEGEQPTVDVSNISNPIIRDNRYKYNYANLDVSTLEESQRREQFNEYHANKNLGNKFGDIVDNVKDTLNPFSIFTETLGEIFESSTGKLSENINSFSNMIYRAFYGDNPDREILNSYLLDPDNREFDIRVATGTAGGEAPRTLGEIFSDLKEKITSGELFLDIEDRIMNAAQPAIDFITRKDDKGLRAGTKEVAKSTFGFLSSSAKDAKKTIKGTKHYVERDGLNYTRKYMPDKTNFDLNGIKENALDTVERYAPHAGFGLKGAGIAGLAGILLPGPALAYATIGGLASMAKKTGDLDNFLFGKEGKGDKKGKKGLLPESWTKALKGKKMFGVDSAKMIAGGAAFGAVATTGLATANAMGLIPHFFMPGGLIGGALLGGAYQLIKHSEGLQSLLFGDKNVFGQRQGGLIPKPLVEAWPNIKKWGSLGLLAGYFLPGGPVLGAILGTIGGALGGTETFRRILWGDYDPVTKFGSKGLLGETMDILQRRILNPFLVTMRKTFSVTKAIKDNYYGSINNEFKNMFQSVGMLLRISIQDAITNAGNKLKKTKFGASIARGIENVLKPFTWGLNKVTGAFGAIFNKVFKAPADIMGSITDFATKKIRQKAETSKNVKAEDIEKLNDIENRRATADVLYQGAKKMAKSKYKTDNKSLKQDNAEAYARSNMTKFVTDLYNKRYEYEDSILNKDGHVNHESIQGMLRTSMTREEEKKLTPQQLERANALIEKNKQREESMHTDIDRINELRDLIKQEEAKTKIDYVDPNDERYKGYVSNKDARKAAKEHVLSSGEAYDAYIKRRDKANEELLRLRSELDTKEIGLRSYIKPTLDKEHKQRLLDTQHKTEEMIRKDFRLNYLRGKLKNAKNPEVREQLIKEIDARERQIKMSRGYDVIKGDAQGTVKTILDPNFDKSNNEILQEKIAADKKGSDEGLIKNVSNTVANTVEELTEQLEQRSSKEIIGDAFTAAVDSIREAFPKSTKAENEVTIETARAAAESTAAVVQTGTQILSDSLESVKETIKDNIKEVINVIKNKDSDNKPKDKDSDSDESNSSESSSQQQEKVEDTVTRKSDDTTASPSLDESTTDIEKVEDTVTRKSDEEIKQQLSESLNAKTSNKYSEKLSSENGEKLDLTAENITESQKQQMQDIAESIYAPYIFSENFSSRGYFDSNVTLAERKREENSAMEFRNAGGTIIDKNDGISMQEQKAMEEQAAIAGSLKTIADNTGFIHENTDELEGLFGGSGEKKENPVWEWLKSLLGLDGKGNGVSGWLAGLMGGTVAPIMSSITGAVTGLGKFLLKGAWNIIKSPSKWLPTIAIGTVAYDVYKGLTAETPDEAYEYYSDALDITATPAMAKTASNLFAQHADDIAKTLTNAFGMLERMLPNHSEKIYKIFGYITNNTDEIMKKCSGLSNKLATVFKVVSYVFVANDIYNGFVNSERYLETYDYTPTDFERILICIVHTLNNSFLFGLLDESWLVVKILEFFGFNTEPLTSAQQRYDELQESTGIDENKFRDITNPTLFQEVANWFTNAREEDVLSRYNAETILAAYYSNIGNEEDAQAAIDRMNSIAILAKEAGIDINKADDYIFAGRDYLIENNKLDAANAGAYALSLAEKYGVSTFGEHSELFDNIDNVTNKAIVYSEGADLDINGMLPAKALVNAVNNGTYNPDTSETGIEGLSNFYNSILSIDGLPVVKPEWLEAYEMYAASYGVLPSAIEDKGIDSNFAEDWVDGKINWNNLEEIIKLGEYKINGKKTKKYLKESEFETRSELIDSNADKASEVKAYNEEMRKYATEEYVTEATNNPDTTESEAVDQSIDEALNKRVDPPLSKAEELGLEEAGWNEKYLEAFERGEWDFDHSSIGEFAAFLRSKNYPLPEWWEAWKIYTAHYGITEDEDITKAPNSFAKDYLAGKIDPFNMQDYYNDYQINGMWDAQMMNKADGKSGFLTGFGNLFNYSTTSQSDLTAKYGDVQDEALVNFSNQFGNGSAYTNEEEAVEDTAVSTPETTTPGNMYTGGNQYMYYQLEDGTFMDANGNVLTNEEINALQLQPEYPYPSMPDIGGYIGEMETFSTDITDEYAVSVENIATDIVTANKDFFNIYTSDMNAYYEGTLAELETALENSRKNTPSANKPTSTADPSGLDNELTVTLAQMATQLDGIQQLTSYGNKNFGGYDDSKKAEKQTFARAAVKKENKKESNIDYKKLSDSFGSVMDDAYKRAHAQDNIKAGIGGSYSALPGINTTSLYNRNLTELEETKEFTKYNDIVDKSAKKAADKANNNTNNNSNNNSNNTNKSNPSTNTQPEEDKATDNTLKKGTWELPVDKASHNYGQFTSPYGWRNWNGTHWHNGIDIDTGTGDNVYSIWPGKVRQAKEGYNSGYGAHIWIDHDNGLSSLYAHQHELFVSDGETVKAGQLIGSSGGKPEYDGDNAGYSSGDHLHLTLFSKHGTGWSTSGGENGPDVNNEFLWNPNAPIPDEIADVVKNTSYYADGSSSSTSPNSSSGNGSDGSSGESSEPSSFADYISRMVSILQSSVMGQTWSPEGDTSSTTGNDTTSSTNLSGITYNGKLGDVNLVDFANLGSRKENFLEAVQKGAINNYLNGGVLPSLTMAQAIHESGWGESRLATEGKALFGIKAGSGWTGKTWTGNTIEYYDSSNPTSIVDNFRAYNSWDESIADHGNLMKKDRYAAVIKATSLSEAANAVKAAGYATDPSYATKIIASANANNLYAVDNEAKKHRGGYDTKDIGGPKASGALKAFGSIAKGSAKWAANKIVGSFFNEVNAKNQELKQFRQSANGGKGGYDEGDKGGIISNIVNAATNIYHKVKDKVTNVLSSKSSNTSSTTTVKGPTIGNSSQKSTNVTDTNNTSYSAPDTSVVERIVTEYVPSKFTDSGAAYGATAVTALGTETSSFAM